MQPQRIPIHANKVLAAILLFLAVLLALPALAVNNNIDETQTFALEGITEIRVSAASTRVHIISAPVGNEVKFRLYGDAPKKIWLECSQQGGVLTVTEAREATITFAQEHMTLDVYLPMNYAQSLAADTSSGELALDALTLDRLSAGSSSGEIKLAPVTAHAVSLVSTSGGITAESITADSLTIEATSGQVTVRALTARDAAVTATSADMNLTYAAFGGDALTVRSTSGKVALALPADASFGFAISRTSSYVQSDFEEIAAFGQEPDTLRGKVNGGEGSVSIACTSGDIEISKR